MTECRKEMWLLRTGKSTSKKRNLCELPPTTEAFGEHVKRAHITTACNFRINNGRNAASCRPNSNWMLEPVTVSEGTNLAPDNLLFLP